MTIVRNVLFGVVLCSASLLGSVGQSQVQKAIPPLTAVPIVFTDSIDASKVQVGESVAAKTIQVVLLPNGDEIPKGTKIVGHVTAARSFSFDPTPYATQQPSVLSIHFDALMTKNGTINASMSVRALADPIVSNDAMTPHYMIEHDIVGWMVQVGGDTFGRDDKTVKSPEGDIVGYNRKEGVFARLLRSESSTRDSSLVCKDSGTAEESVAIFSASACGLYGLPDVYMSENGLGDELGTVRLESRRHTVKLHAQSTALLQIINVP